MQLGELNTLEERISLLEKVSKPFSERAQMHDEAGTFPFENFKALKEIGYPGLAVPKKYGGAGVSLYELVRFQETLGKHDGSTALSIGWHMGIMKRFSEKQVWEETKYKALVSDVLKTGALINNLATEASTGSPTRGGRPETVAKQTSDGWVISGRKTFSTMAPILDYFIVSASIDETEEVGNFLVKRGSLGLSIDETWDSIAMRGTGSHDLVLEEVSVGKDDLVEGRTPGKGPASGWLLHIPACYLGIARAAEAYAVSFAKDYSPSSIEGTIADLPTVRQRIGEMALLILQSEHFLYSVAKQWDSSSDEEKQLMKPELGAAKLTVVNNALKVVDLAMRIVGARSLSRQNPLQRYYRDVRAGLHNPPMDDMTIMQLAAVSIEKR